MPDGVTQVQLTEDGSRPVDLPPQFATVADMVQSYTTLQGAHTQLSQAQATPPVTPPAPTKPVKTDDMSVATASALQTITTFNETQRKLRFESQVGPEGAKALEDFIGGSAIDAGVKAAYEAAIDSGNEALIDANFSLVRSIFEQQNGAFAEPQSFVSGAAGGVIIPAGTTAFATLDEQLAAQKDPKYDADPSFRAEVEHRIAISGPYRV
jgi:hypothetical protein